MSAKMNRRSFLTTTAVVGAAGLVGGQLLTACSGGKKDGKASPLREPGSYYVPELPDKAIDGRPLKCGLIGCGGRGNGAVGDLLTAADGITITALVANKVALSDAVAVTNQVLDDTPLPSSLYSVISGDYEDQQKMFSDMGLLMVLMILLVYIVMAAQFESFMSPFVIMFSLPFAAVGVILGLWLTGTALSVMGMVGIIILIGIVVKNGIVLIDYTILCRERGMSVLDASVTAARSRLRPILMTTLTTVLGMLPMALGNGDGAELWNGLGMVVCWGLSISTLVTLVLIPTVYCVFATRQERRASKKYEII